MKESNKAGNIMLAVKGIGNCPSFKNRKRAILDSNTGKMRTLTEPKTKQWMNQCINQFELGLLTALAIREGETVGAWRKRLQIALLPLQDDCWKNMLPGDQNVKMVEQGMEGVEVELEYL